MPPTAEQKSKAHPGVFTLPPDVSPKPGKAGQMSQEQLDHFFREGYVILDDFLDKNLLEKIKAQLEVQVDRTANKLFKAGKINNLYSDQDLYTRMISLNKEFPGASLLHYRSDDNMVPAIKELWSNEKLLDAIEQIVGPDIAGNPIWNLRIKLPRNEAEEIPWHQDNAYFEENAMGTMIATAWIPLLDTHKGNGGMAMVKRSHQSGVLGDHYCCTGGTFYIEIDEDVIEETFDTKMSEAEVECKVNFGSVLLFNNSTVHCSYSNLSSGIRWAMDFRFQDPKKPNGRPESNDCMPIFRKGGEHVNDIDWRVLIDRRHKNDVEAFNKEGSGNKPDSVQEEVVDEFDTRISGPWMTRWPIKHHNRHTALAGIAPPTKD